VPCFIRLRTVPSVMPSFVAAWAAVLGVSLSVVRLYGSLPHGDTRDQ
jgi:hypothetical protein